MLDSRDKNKIEQYIDKMISKLRLDAEKDLKNGVSKKAVLDKLVNATVKKMTPESKAILSSVYNMMMDHTLAKEMYQDVERKAAYYELDIMKELNNKFDFEVPAYIDYTESKQLLNKYTGAGVVTVAGGFASLSLKTWIPITIAVIIAGLMIWLIEDQKDINEDVNVLIDKYLKNVKETLINWIFDIEKYYDEKVSTLESEM